ncbi:uncharacterized protein LOC123680187 [Harmonia axyridis]|uniref:uncharacterized protein LOC123680187 n=1 Tax=Harmonia axyridis TaxID=115357 RepID=UPI001E275DC2|nr:uncharacterized protein LOC123680187 [Harmonia axyridis]
MWKIVCLLFVACAFSASAHVPRSGNELVSMVVSNCVDMDCVKLNVLKYLDGLLHIEGDSARGVKDIDAAIFKRVAKVLRTNEFRFKLPQALFDGSEIVYNPKTGLDISEDSQSRGILKKKLLFPILLLMKLKMQLLMPVLLGLIGLKSIKALIISKLALGVVLGFLIYQLCTKAGMPMPMSMAPMPSEPPSSIYGPPSTAPPLDSYNPNYDPSASQGGPYARIWTPTNGEAQQVAYSAYYPGSGSSSTTQP